MVITSNLILQGDIWRKTVEAYEKIFTQRTIFEVFTLALSIGVLYDQRIEALTNSEEYQPPEINRNLFLSYGEILDELFQTAILTTKTIELSDKERLNLAFGENDKEFDKRAFLIPFANFGVTKLVEQIAEDPFETAENLKDFLVLTVEGHNVDLDIVDEVELTEEELDSLL